MTWWSPSNCLCISHVESETLLIQCNRHNNYNDMWTENKIERMKFGSNPNQDEIRIMQNNIQDLRNTSTRTNNEKQKVKRFKTLINNPKTNKKLNGDLLAKRSVTI